MSNLLLRDSHCDGDPDSAPTFEGDLQSVCGGGGVRVANSSARPGLAARNLQIGSDYMQYGLDGTLQMLYIVSLCTHKNISEFSNPYI